MSLSELAGRVLRGYARILRSLGETFLVLAGISATAFAVALPLWWLAVHRRGLYTALIAGAGLAAASILGYRRIRSRRGAVSGELRPRPGRILPGLLIAAGVYGSAVLFTRSLVLGLSAAVVLAGVAGAWAFGRGGRIDRSR